MNVLPCLAFVVTFLVPYLELPPNWRLSHTQPCLVQDQQSPRDQACWDAAKSQLTLNDCAAKDAHEADAEMAKAYDKVLSKFKDNPDRIARIKRAQQTWLSFRRTEIEALFGENDRASGGSAFTMCLDLRYASLTAQRTSELQALVDGQEGDVCSPQ